MSGSLFLSGHSLLHIFVRHLCFRSVEERLQPGHRVLRQNKSSYGERSPLPRMIRILVCLRETNRAAGCFHKHARAEPREGFITVQATTAYHVKKGSHSSKHPLFLWSADTIGVWRALSSDLSLKDASRPPGSGRASSSVRLSALLPRGSIRLIKIRQTQLIAAALLHYYQLPNIYSLSRQRRCTRDESSISPAQILLLLLLSTTRSRAAALFMPLERLHTNDASLHPHLHQPLFRV